METLFTAAAAGDSHIWHAALRVAFATPVIGWLGELADLGELTSIAASACNVNAFKHCIATASTLFWAASTLWWERFAWKSFQYCACSKAIVSLLCRSASFLGGVLFRRLGLILPENPTPCERRGI